MGSVLDAKHFRDEAAAYKWVEARVWPNGRVCPHCGSVDDSGPLKGKSTRLGVYKCYAKECRKPFTVKVGTIFESSHIKLHIWLQAMFLLASSKKGISSNQLARTLGVTLKSAWFLSHRIREAMKDTGGAPFGGNFGGVEADETLQGVDPRYEVKPDAPPQNAWRFNRVMTLIDRDTGRARSFVLTEFNAAEVQRIFNENIAKEAYLLTDGPALGLGSPAGDSPGARVRLYVAGAVQPKTTGLTLPKWTARAEHLLWFISYYIVIRN